MVDPICAIGKLKNDNISGSHAKIHVLVSYIRNNLKSVFYEKENIYKAHDDGCYDPVGTEQL